MASEGIVMNTRRLRPKWTLGTMLLVVGWSSVVVWLNVTPRVRHLPLLASEELVCKRDYGFPLTYAYATYLHPHTEPCPPLGFHLGILSTCDYSALVQNIAKGLIAVVILTWTSKAILSALRAFMSRRQRT